MFTGIIEEIGTVKSVEPIGGGMRLTIECAAVLADAGLGDSIAVNGCCLTVVEQTPTTWTTVAQIETIDRTTTGTLRAGTHVNLERPMRLGDRLDGHIVQGHVDGIGTVATRVAHPDGSTQFHFTASAAILKYVVEKGSITVDGISLTVTDVDEAGFGVAIIPHTLVATVLGDRSPGDAVNLEVDVIAKYVERLVSPHLP
jgi:riboflavin synthase